MPLPLPLDGTTVAAPSPRWSHRAALYALCVGAFAVVLLALPYKAFELDRHFVPKEGALHLTTAIAALCALAGTRRVRMTRIDLLLALFLLCSLLSAIGARNWWAAERALAISVSSVLVYWVAGTVGRDQLRTPLFVGLILAMLAGVATALAQAYGLVGDYASLSRAPGGTFGNRNFMAHLAVICMPALLYLTLRARRPRGFILGACALLVVSGALVLSRSRAAWLALIAGLVLSLPALWKLRRYARPAATKRASVLLVAAGIGVAAAIVIPNTLEWNSDSPYLDSMRGVVNYKDGSGRGRIIQYERTLKLALANPLFGVGTGNWAVAYPVIAPGDDPSIASDGRTANPWPSSDLMAILSERGIPAFLCFLLAMLGFLAGALHRWRSAGSSAEERGAAIVLGATVVVTLVVGTFDAVLSIAIPALFAWAIIGALVPRVRSRDDTTLGSGRRSLLMLAAGVAGLVFTMRSVAQGYAMALYDRGTTTALRKAAQLDPGSYRIQLRLATRAKQRGRCTDVRIHAKAAHALFPDAPRPARLLRSCGVRIE
jgi:O-antigen ligase